AARHFDRCANNASLHPPPAALRRCCPNRARCQLRYTPKYVAAQRDLFAAQMRDSFAEIYALRTRRRDKRRQHKRIIV
ncbi:MAG: hypothetical protein IJL00_02990, partial [Clostridia bacterium]|nr:hypothetical protein [Clostridia bacterium]